MAKESSFDIVSKVELPEVQNAVQAALKEIKNRYDFKGSKSDISLEKEELVLISDDDFKLEHALGGTVRQRAKLISGIDQDNAKKINALIKQSGIKVKSQFQDDQVRVTGKNKDDLQEVISLMRKADLPIDVQFINFR